MFRTRAVIDIEEQTDKNIEDFCDDEYFRETYGDDWCEDHNRDVEEELAEEER